MAVSRDNWKALDALLEEALARPIDERSAFLRARCGDQTNLYEELTALLADAAEAEFVLGESVTEYAAALLDGLLTRLGGGDKEAALAPGDLIGRYRIVEVIGRGGMGTVYLAERADGTYLKRVAIKVLRRGRIAADVVRRFEQERQLLALLEHPHIARLIDGGTTQDGRPYLVMEHVEGQPITAYADDRKLSISARLALVEQVVGAVRHAHNRLVVHRDLKPANVLVRDADDGAPQVVLLDFGIALLLGNDAAGIEDGNHTWSDEPARAHRRVGEGNLESTSEGAPMTRPSGPRPMTPAYAAPEQLAGEPVTTQADVYALGLLLFELLGGAGKVQQARAGLKPSDAVDEIHARMVGVPLVRLRRSLVGDLDAIVSRALAPEPSARYASAEDLLNDLRRHADALPVEARPAAVGYRLSRFFRRNRAATSGLAAFILLLLASVVMLAVQERKTARERDRATVERDKAAAVAAFMEEMFLASDPFDAERRDTIRVASLLAEGAERLQTSLQAQPIVRAQMMAAIGRTLTQVRRFDEAEPLLTAALDIRERESGARSVETAESQYDLASMYYNGADKGPADSLAELALATRVAAYGERSTEVADTKALLGQLAENSGDAESAEAYFREAIAIYRDILGRSDRRVARGYELLATSLLLAGDIEGTAAAYDSAVVLHREFRGPDHPLVGATLSNYAFLKVFERDYEGAERLQREAIALMEPAFGRYHPRMVSVYNQFGLILRRRNLLDEAEAVLSDILAWQRSTLEDGAFSGGHNRLAASITSLASVYVDQGRVEDAIALRREAFDVAVQHLPAPARVIYAGHLSRLLTSQERYREAESTLLALRDDPAIAPVEGSLARHLIAVYTAWGKPDEAARWQSGGQTMAH